MSKYIKQVFLCLMMTSVFCFLTACQNEIPDLSQEEMTQVEEYAAHLLLKYDKNYSSSVLDEEEIQKQVEDLEARAQVQQQVKENQEAAKEKEEADENQKAESSDDTTKAEEVQKYVDIADFLGMENVLVEHTGTVIGQKYPDDTEANDWQGVAVAGRGNLIVAYEFTVTNNNDFDYLVDVKSQKLKASVKINDTITKTPVTTMLTNDFLYYSDVVPAMGSSTMVLIIELPEDKVVNIQSAVLTLKGGSDKYVTNLL